ncbi:MAG TPA: phosphoribosyltransferase family protein [Longimicrobium sp.]|nr:phosphoribosyltransferase family protein [Longimicrobium sp.]
MTALGWTSGLTEAIRADLRTRSPHTLTLATRLLAHRAAGLMSGRTENLKAAPVIVPVPTSGTPDPVLRLASSLGDTLGVAVVPAVVREKRESARHSVAAGRRRIAADEYMLREQAAGVAGRPVLLLDDMVTTGHTLSGVARLLRIAGATDVRPLVLDRTASVRALQRADQRAWDACPHAAKGTGVDDTDHYSTSR